MFHIGQRVVCIKSHSRRCTVRGRPYTVLAIHTCRCGAVSIHVGLTDRVDGYTCDCGRKNATGWWGQGAERFRPIDDLTASLAQTESERQVEERPDHIHIPQHT